MCKKIRPRPSTIQTVINIWKSITLQGILDKRTTVGKLLVGSLTETFFFLYLRCNLNTCLQNRKRRSATAEVKLGVRNGRNEGRLVQMSVYYSWKVDRNELLHQSQLDFSFYVRRENRFSYCWLSYRGTPVCGWCFSRARLEDSRFRQNTKRPDGHSTHS